MNYQAIWSWNAADGWSFMGYAPGAARASQMVRALNQYYLGEPRYWFGAYPSNYVVSRTVWPGWYRMLALGNDGRKYDYGWYTGGFTQRAAFALRALLANSTYTVVAVDDAGYGYRVMWPDQGYYSTLSRPDTVPEATVRSVAV